MNFQQFKKHITTLEQEALSEYHDELFDQMRAAKDQSDKLAISLALDEICIQINLLDFPTDDLPPMTDQELLNELQS